MGRHLTQAVQSSGGRPGEEAAIGEMERDGRAARQERVGGGAKAHRSARDIDDEAAPARPRQLGGRDAEFVELATTDHAELAGGELEQCGSDHTRQGVVKPADGKPNRPATVNFGGS